MTAPPPIAPLAEELIVLLEGGIDRRITDDTFNGWALRVFRYQLATTQSTRS